MQHHCNRSRLRVPLHRHAVDDRNRLRLQHQRWQLHGEQHIAKTAPQRGEDTLFRVLRNVKSLAAGKPCLSARIYLRWCQKRIPHSASLGAELQLAGCSLPFRLPAPDSNLPLRSPPVCSALRSWAPPTFYKHSPSCACFLWTHITTGWSLFLFSSPRPDTI